MRELPSFPHIETETETDAGAVIDNRTRKLLQRRLRLAESGGWRAVTHEYLLAVIQHQEQEDSEASSVRTCRLFNKVIAKDMGGCDRAAHRFLAGTACLLP